MLCLKPAYAANVKLEWDTSGEPELDYYIVYWGTSSGYYTNNSGDIGKATNYYVSPYLADDTTYCFVVRAVRLVEGVEFESRNSREVCLLGSNDLDPGYDRGWAITTGDLKGFRIMYSSTAGITPTLGSSSDIPALHDEFPDKIGVGAPLNLQPSPTSDFYSPVKISIPCPGYSDVSNLDLYYYNGRNWVLANDGDDPGTILPDADGWMVPGSRVNHSGGTPSTIEIQVYHFSGVEAADTSSSNSSGGGGGGGGCFIATAAFRGN